VAVQVIKNWIRCTMPIHEWLKTLHAENTVRETLKTIHAVERVISMYAIRSYCDDKWSWQYALQRDDGRKIMNSLFCTLDARNPNPSRQKRIIPKRQQLD
jgi:hypothetical protein